jgi:hypothetical protein
VAAQAAQTVRDVVAESEAELQQELGRSRFEQLRDLLIELKATPLVRAFHGRNSSPAAEPVPKSFKEA